MLPHHRGLCQYGQSPTSYSVLRPGFPDTINRGQTSCGKHSWPVNSISKNTITCKTIPPECPTSQQMTNSDKRQGREGNQVFIPYAATWMPQHFPGQTLPFCEIFICLWMGLKMRFSQFSHIRFWAMSSSSFRSNCVSHLLVQNPAKHQRCLNQLVIKPNQQIPSFLCGHVQSAYRV